MCPRSLHGHNYTCNLYWGGVNSNWRTTTYSVQVHCESVCLPCSPSHRWSNNSFIQRRREQTFKYCMVLTTRATSDGMTVTACTSGGVYVTACNLWWSLCNSMYLWWSLSTLYLHACQVRVAVGDSGLCCTCVTYFEC